MTREGLNSNVRTHHPYQTMLHPKRHQERASLEPNMQHTLMKLKWAERVLAAQPEC